MATPALYEPTSPTENRSFRDSAEPWPVCPGRSHGLVLIDGVDSPNHLIKRSLPFLTSTPVAAVLAPPSRCNRNVPLQHLLTSMPWISVDVIDGTGHGDIESGAVAIYRRICGEELSTETAALQLRAVMHHIETMRGPSLSRGHF